MVIFYSYVSLPEGTIGYQGIVEFFEAVAFCDYIINL